MIILRTYSASMFVCPDCRKELKRRDDALRCAACGRIFSIGNGIFHLLPSRLSKEKMAEINLYQSPHGFEGKAVKELLSNPLEVSRYLAHEIFRFKKEILEKNFIYGRVLELGSGLGWSSILVKRRYPSIVSYVSEISDTVLLSARRLAESVGVKIDFFVQCDAEKLPFPDNYFDFIFSWALIHHLPSPTDMFSEARRVLKPMGRFIAGAEPCVSPMAERILEGVIGRMLAQKEIFVYSKKRSRAYGILENTYAFDEWCYMLRSAGIKNFRINFNDTWSRGMSLLRLSYNTLTKLMPKVFIMRYLPVSTIIRFQKD